MPESPSAIMLLIISTLATAPLAFANKNVSRKPKIQAHRGL